MNGRRGTFTGPLIVIGLGLLLLAENLDALPRGFWGELIRLWPAALVLVGLELIVRSAGRIGGFLAFVVAAVGVIGTVALAWALADEPRDTRLYDSPLGDAIALDVVAELGAAGIDIVASGPGSPVEVEVSGPPSAVDVELEDRNGNFQVRLDTEPQDAVPFDDLAEIDLRLPPDVPVSLELDLGFGAANVDLRGLNVASLYLSSGVSSTEVWLPSNSLDVIVDGGVGRLTLRVPENLPIRVYADAGVANVDLPNDLVEQPDGSHASPDYETGNGVNITADLGVGSIAIRRVSD